MKDRRAALLDACLGIIGEKPWEDVSMADVALAAGVSKPLLYHYFATKRDLHLATVAAAADQLRVATRPDPSLPASARMRAALDAHLRWIDEHADAYRAVLQGGISSDPDVRDIVERSRSEVVDRLAAAFFQGRPTATQRIALRGWVGFLEAASLEWLSTRAVTRDELASLLAASATRVLDLR